MFVNTQQKHKNGITETGDAEWPINPNTGLNASGGGFITDAQRCILSVYGAFEAITGYTSAEVVGKTPALFKSSYQDIFFYQQMWTAINHNRYWEGEIYNRRKNGKIYLQWGQISAVHDNAGMVTNYFTHFSDITGDKKEKEDLQYLALYDHLTSLPNRRMLESRIDLAMARTKRHNKLFAICMIDLDNFKPINDTYGHDAGDEVLVILGKRLPKSLRKTDITARFGGDEFVLLIEEITSVTDLAVILPKVEKAISAPIFLKNGATVQVGASLGVCIYPFGTEETSDQLLHYADQALYESKSHKADRKTFYTFFNRSKAHGE